MPLRRVAAGITLIVMLSACGSAASTGSTPAAVTAAPGAAGTPAATAVPAATAAPAVTAPPVAAPGTSQQALPSFAGDPELAARFPKEVAGQPVTNVRTASFIDFLHGFNTDQAKIDTFRQTLASMGMNLDTVTVGFATATVSGSPVAFQAIRVPGQDANKLIQNYAQLDLTAFNQGDTLSKETVGGKNVSVIRSSAGYASTWMYANGDILWQLNTSDQQAAEAVFTALP
jgi:hypothetical protein